jgi:hypothetical protein
VSEESPVLHVEVEMSRRPTQPPARRSSSQPPWPVPVVLAGLDSRTEAVVRAAASEGGTFTVEVFADLWRARAHIEQLGDATAILVTDTAQLRRRLVFAPSVHVIAVSGPDKSSRDGVIADEIVSQPLDRKELEVRLRLAARTLAGQAGKGPSAVLRDALAAGKTGEVIVRSEGEDEVARIHVQGGKIGWIHRSKHRVSMRAMLTEGGVAMDDETAREVMDESRRTRRHFGDVLIALKVVDEQALRQCLQRQLSRELGAVLQWQDALATFVRDERSLASQLAFDESELRVTPRKSRRILTEPGFPAVTPDEPLADPAAIDGWLDQLAALDAVIGCALLDAKNGHNLGSRNLTAEHETIAWRMVGSFVALRAEDGEVLAVTRTHGYLVRSAAPRVAAVAVLCFDPTRLSAAMARILVAKAIGGEAVVTPINARQSSGPASNGGG